MAGHGSITHKCRPAQRRGHCTGVRATAGLSHEIAFGRTRGPSAAGREEGASSCSATRPPRGNWAAGAARAMCSSSPLLPRAHDNKHNTLTIINPTPYRSAPNGNFPFPWSCCCLISGAVFYCERGRKQGHEPTCPPALTIGKTTSIPCGRQVALWISNWTECAYVPSGSSGDVPLPTGGGGIHDTTSHIRASNAAPFAY